MHRLVRQLSASPTDWDHRPQLNSTLHQADTAQGEYPFIGRMNDTEYHELIPEAPYGILQSPGGSSGPYGRESSQHAEEWETVSIDLAEQTYDPNLIEFNRELEMDEPPWSTVNIQQDHYPVARQARMSNVMHRVDASRGSATSELNDAVRSSSLTSYTSTYASSSHQDVNEMQSSILTVCPAEASNAIGWDNAGRFGAIWPQNEEADVPVDTGRKMLLALESPSQPDRPGLYRTQDAWSNL